MPRAKLKLTEARINRWPPSSSTVFCGELKGFGVRAREVNGKRTFTCVVQRDVPLFPGSKDRRTRTVTYPQKGKSRGACWSAPGSRGTLRRSPPKEQHAHHRHLRRF